MWTKGNYRRNLMDMHIDDWNDTFLTKVDPVQYVSLLKEAGIQNAMVMSKSHTGLCYWPSSIGRMHRGLAGRDFFGQTIEECHAMGITVVAYFSLIFDNWAYENHPDWRQITSDGKAYRDYVGLGGFKTGRYGICCPNNPDYRAYIKANLQELNTKYTFEGMFLDMTFWPEHCYCPSCRSRYMEEKGKEIPRVMDWDGQNWLEYYDTFKGWLLEFAMYATKCVKDLKPEVTIEHQYSPITCDSRMGVTDLQVMASDYAGGDYYGGFLEQSFINKYYRNISPTLPFDYHTSRCEPNLLYHTTTKTRDEMFLHVITALVHEGAFTLVDAINPDGSVYPKMYKIMKDVYDESRLYEPYVGGALKKDIAILFSSRNKVRPSWSGHETNKLTPDPNYYLAAARDLFLIMRENHVPCDVIPSSKINDLADCKVLALPFIYRLDEDEMDDIEAFVKSGGNLYVSGPIGHKKLALMLGVEKLAPTAHSFTYMSPTEEGTTLFPGFDEKAPLSVPAQQYGVRVTGSKTKVLATLNLPYTLPGTKTFSAIHANPPGVQTDVPAAVLASYGAGRILWVSAPIECSSPYHSKNVVLTMMKNLMEHKPFVETNAPKTVEIITFEHENKLRICLINHQERPPVDPAYHIWLDINTSKTVKAVRHIKSGKVPEYETFAEKLRIHIPVLKLFTMLEIDF